MLDNNENSIERSNVVYEVQSVLPIERLNELRNILANFQDDWESLFINIYPIEVRKLLNEFSHLEFVVFEGEEYIPTILCKISKFSN